MSTATPRRRKTTPPGTPERPLGENPPAGVPDDSIPGYPATKPALHLNHPLDEIHESATNPRTSFDPDKLADLAASIRQHGVLQPVLVRINRANCRDTGYEVICGARRVRAARRAGLDTIPAIVRSNLTTKEVLEIQAIENVQRDDLPILEESDAYSTLLRDHGYTAASLAERLGKSTRYVARRVALADLPITARQALDEGRLTLTVANQIAQVHPDLRAEVCSDVIPTPRAGGHCIPMLAEHAARIIRTRYARRLHLCGWPLDDATLVPESGPCTTCTRRTGAHDDLFGAADTDDVCLDGKCFDLKRDALTARTLDDYRARGWTVLTGPDADEYADDCFDNKFPADPKLNIFEYAEEYDFAAPTDDMTPRTIAAIIGHNANLAVTVCMPSSVYNKPTAWAPESDVETLLAAAGWKRTIPDDTDTEPRLMPWQIENLRRAKTVDDLAESILAMITDRSNLPDVGLLGLITRAAYALLHKQLGPYRDHASPNQRLRHADLIAARFGLPDDWTKRKATPKHHADLAPWLIACIASAAGPWAHEDLTEIAKHLRIPIPTIEEPADPTD